MADNGKKQIPLRLSEKLYDAIAAWAEDDFRSVNGQIEYLLTECVRQRKKNGNLLSYIPITGEKIFGAVHTATEKICALIPCAMCAGRKKRSE